MTQAVHRAVQLIESCELFDVVKFRRRPTELLRDLDRKLDRGRNVDLGACAGCRARYHRFGRDRHADDRRVKRTQHGGGPMGRLPMMAFLLLVTWLSSAQPP